MLKYLKEAFWVRWPLPGLGDVPINVLAMFGVAALGFLNPGFWFLGLGAEAAFLWSLAGNPRFRKLVDAPQNTQKLMGARRKQQSLIQQLDSSSAERLAKLKLRRKKIEKLYADFAPNDFAARENIDNLKRLEWMFLKLLTAEHHLQKASDSAKVEDLKEQIRDLESELEKTDLSKTARDSKFATSQILEERLRTHESRESAILEIASDLTRIEAQAELTLEKATMKTKPGEMSFNLNLASHLLESNETFGSSFQVVQDLDQTYDDPVPLEEAS